MAIKTLKKRERIDALKNDVRAGGIAWGRYVYLSLLATLFLFILNFFAGHYIFLNAEGLVIKDSYTVAPLYTARVKKVYVQRGDTIQNGKKLLELESANLMLQLAQISTDVANLANKTAQLKAKTRIAKVLLPTATAHANHSNYTLSRLQGLKSKTLVTSQRFEEAMSNKISANTNLSRLQAEDAVYAEELQYIKSAQNDAISALKKLKSLYNDGKVISPIAGIVGAKLCTEGDVVLAGKPLLQIYRGNAYVLAFLPRSYLFKLSIGQKVIIRAGKLSAIGIIEKRLPLAASMPKEFQNSIKPTGRQQLLRIKLPIGHPFVISQNIKIKAIWFGEKQSQLLENLKGSILPSEATVTSVTPSQKSITRRLKSITTQQKPP